MYANKQKTFCRSFFVQHFNFLSNKYQVEQWLEICKALDFMKSYLEQLCENLSYAWKTRKDWMCVSNVLVSYLFSL